VSVARTFTAQPSKLSQLYKFYQGIVIAVVNWSNRSSNKTSFADTLSTPFFTHPVLSKIQEKYFGGCVKIQDKIFESKLDFESATIFVDIKFIVGKLLICNL
jgi:hypothetical protein